jgi:hypothetical protein
MSNNKLTMLTFTTLSASNLELLRSLTRRADSSRHSPGDGGRLREGGGAFRLPRHSEAKSGAFSRPTPLIPDPRGPRTKPSPGGLPRFTWRGQGEGELFSRQAHKRIQQAPPLANPLFLIHFRLPASHSANPGWTNAVQPKLFWSCTNGLLNPISGSRQADHQSAQDRAISS